MRTSTRSARSFPNWGFKSRGCCPYLWGEQKRIFGNQSQRSKLKIGQNLFSVHSFLTVGEHGCKRGKSTFIHLGIWKRSSDCQLNPMERWNVGILGIKNGESVPFGSRALRLRIASLRQEAKNSWPSASSPPEADAPPTSFRVINPSFQYSP
jgi:hypothetical protein